jgi:amidase
MAELHRLTARALRDAVAARELSAVEVVSAHLERIEQVNARVNAIVTLESERALADAAALDAAAADGRPPGMLAGLPIAVKDLVDTAGSALPTDRRSTPTTCPPRTS